jgi:hypothetical protein
MSKTILRLLPAIIIIVLVVSWGVATIAGSYYYNNGETPRISMNTQYIAPGPYEFTVVDVSEDDVLWSDIRGVVSPKGPTLTIPTTGYVGVGDVVTFSGWTSGTTYWIELKFKPTGGTAFSIPLIEAA